MERVRKKKGRLWSISVAQLLLFFVVAVAGAQQGQDWDLLPTEQVLVIKGPAGNPLRQPTDVAAGPNGKLYVMDGVNSRVAVFDSRGNYKMSFGSRGHGPGEMDLPVGIGISPEGQVYVADSGNHRIQVFDPGGRYLRSFPLKTGTSADPTDVLPLKIKNRCYVVDNDNHSIQAYDSGSGALVTEMGGGTERTSGNFGTRVPSPQTNTTIFLLWTS